jgi:mannobiose 2-epimerase
MNTHLHILEAYTNLYRIYKNDQVKMQLEHLLKVFPEKIWDKETGHLRLFFENNWNVLSEIESFGHDIEFTWLLCEAAEVLGDITLLREAKNTALKTTETILKEGLHESGGLYYEKTGSGILKQFDWWPQAEAVTGFFNSWQISKNSKYLDLSLQSWEFLKNHIIDKKNGEWFWGVNLKFEPVNTEKVNSWKSLYHNSRMCLEMIKRIEQTNK